MSVTTTGNTIFADRDPTASDDLAHTGVDRGVWWVNTSSGAIFVLSAEHPSATWLPAVSATISDAVTASTAAIAALPINNSAASAPGVGNDNTEGYSVFSLWIDTTGPDIYMATGVGTGAAAWKLIFDAVP